MSKDNGLGTCPDTCLSLDDNPHLPPIVDWIGDTPIMHGERDVPYGHPEQGYCLCGHPWYALCPERETGSVMSMVLGEEYFGRLNVEEDES